MFGFKASLNFFGKNNKGLHTQLSPDMTVSGAYRTSRDDSFGFLNSFDQAKKPSDQVLQQIRPTKSANDLTKVKNATPNLRHSTANVSADPRGTPQEDPRNGAQNRKLTKEQEKQQKKLEKQRIAEQKAREKLIAKEQAKQEKLRREREKKEAQQMKARNGRRPEAKRAPQPQVATPAPPQAPAQYPTNTLESSISRSSGPPPYSDKPTPGPAPSSSVKNQGESSGNVILSKPEDTGSWDMISQHRQQTIRPTTVIGGGGNKNKQMVMDLNYNFGATSQNKENSDA